MLLNNLLYANPNTSSDPVCVLKLLISSCYSFQSQKCVLTPLSISWKLPHAPEGSPVPLICLNYSHYAAVRQFKHPSKRILCFQCQINVRPQWRQHEQKVFFNFSNKKWTLQLRVSRYSIWAVNSHGFQHKLETLICLQEQRFFHPSSKHHIQAGATDGERHEKMLLLLIWTGTYHVEGMEGRGTLPLSANHSLQLFRKIGKFLLNVNMSAAWYAGYLIPQAALTQNQLCP